MCCTATMLKKIRVEKHTTASRVAAEYNARLGRYIRASANNTMRMSTENTMQHGKVFTSQRELQGILLLMLLLTTCKACSSTFCVAEFLRCWNLALNKNAIPFY